MSTLQKTSELLRIAEDRILLFWLKPASPRPLAALRIGVASVLLYQAALQCGSVAELFGPHGLIAWDALNTTDAFPLDVGGPFHLSHVGRMAERLGMAPVVSVQIMFGVYLFALTGMLLGLRTKMSTTLAFLIHLALTSTAVATTYGVDQFARIALFYCVCFPTADCLSVDARRRRQPITRSVKARIGIRTLQLHLALMYLATGLHKASGPQWWDGEAIWRAITLPQLATVDLTWLAAYPRLLIMLGWSTLAIEVGYVFFAWHRTTRRPVVAAIISMHLGIALFMGLVSFALMMIVLNVAAFLTPSDPPAIRRSDRGRSQFPQTARRFQKAGLLTT